MRPNSPSSGSALSQRPNRVPKGIDQPPDEEDPEGFDVYYGMADTRIGMARLRLPTALAPADQSNGVIRHLLLLAQLDIAQMGWVAYVAEPGVVNLISLRPPPSQSRNARTHP